MVQVVYQLRKKSNVKNFNKNKEKLFEQDETNPFYDWVIQPSD